MSGGDRLVLTGMRFFGHHGDVEAERILGGQVDVDVELEADLRPAGTTDRLADTIDYTRCFEVVRDVVENHQFNLLEAIAEGIASRLLAETAAATVRVRVAKRPPLRGTIRRCAVVIERTRAG